MWGPEAFGPLQLLGMAVHVTLELSYCMEGLSIERLQSSFNPLSPTLFLIVAEISLPKRSVPYWSNPPFNFLTF